MSAPLETGGWDKALRQMAHHTGSARGELVAFGGAHSVPFNWITDATDGALDEFLAIGGGDPEVNWRVGCAAAVKLRASATAARRLCARELSRDARDREPRYRARGGRDLHRATGDY